MYVTRLAVCYPWKLTPNLRTFYVVFISIFIINKQRSFVFGDNQEYSLTC